MRMAGPVVPVLVLVLILLLLHLPDGDAFCAAIGSNPGFSGPPTVKQVRSGMYTISEICRVRLRRLKVKFPKDIQIQYNMQLDTIKKPLSYRADYRIKLIQCKAGVRSKIQ